MPDREVSGAHPNPVFHIWDATEGKCCLCGDADVRIIIQPDVVNAETIDVCCPVCLRALQAKAGNANTT